jgi:hypothetical protein
MSGCECKPDRAQPSIEYERLRMQARRGAQARAKRERDSAKTSSEARSLKEGRSHH